MQAQHVRETIYELSEYLLNTETHILCVFIYLAVDSYLYKQNSGLKKMSNDSAIITTE